MECDFKMSNDEEVFNFDIFKAPPEVIRDIQKNNNMYILEDGEYIIDEDLTNKVREAKLKENELINKQKEIDELKNIINDLLNMDDKKIILNKYLIKLVMDSDLFSEEEKEGLDLILEDFDMAFEKELELNNIMEISTNINAVDWEEETNYYVGDYVKYEGDLYKIIQSHKSQSNWYPPQVPAIYKLIAKKEEVENIDTDYPEFVQPNGNNGYSKGDIVKFNNNIYESMIDNNVWSPEAYPAGWKLIE